MVQLIIGERGKGKTKILLDKANTQIKTANGNVVYLDKNKQHMYELNNRVRLIDVTNYPLENSDAFIGFLCGLISRDNDLEQVYLDSFLKIAKVQDGDVTRTLERIDNLSKTFGVDFMISASLTREQLPEKFAEMIINE
ncbi:MAG: twitching motility protein PilT [Lachnospiraceae bacterium]|nr:twitching motility protein PilT [Lachnospiraceae bacterium]